MYLAFVFQLKKIKNYISINVPFWRIWPSLELNQLSTAYLCSFLSSEWDGDGSTDEFIDVLIFYGTPTIKHGMFLDLYDHHLPNCFISL